MRLRAFVFAALCVSACSLITNFDPDGQPCDTSAFDPAQECLSDAGYWCVNGFCRKTAPPGVGGGSATGGGSAAGGGSAVGGGSATGGGVGGGGGNTDGGDGGTCDGGKGADAGDGGC